MSVKQPCSKEYVVIRSVHYGVLLSILRVFTLKSHKEMTYFLK